MQYYINGNSLDSNGNKCAYFTEEVEHKTKRLWWQERGLMYSASGYGSRIPTEAMIKWRGRWRRVYCCIWSNSGTCYIGKLSDRLFVGADHV